MSSESPFLTLAFGRDSSFEVFSLEDGVRFVSQPENISQELKEITPDEIRCRIAKGELPEIKEGRITLSALPQKERIQRFFQRHINNNKQAQEGKKNLLVMIQYLYNRFDRIEQKRACLHYLLHYQHYNAEFTHLENQRLGYPFPLHGLQEKPGYFRSEHHRILHLMTPWLKRYIPKKAHDFLSRQEPFSIMTITTHNGFQIMGNISTQKPIKVIDVSPADLEKTGVQLAKAAMGKRLEPNSPYFLFRMRHPHLDLSFTWVGIWNPQWCRLESHPLNTIYGREIYAHLRSSGSIPDRFTMHQCITFNLKNESINAVLRGYLDRLPPTHATVRRRYNWEDDVKKMEACDFSEERGSQLYCKAILKWHACLSKDSELANVARSLFEIEVAPWIQDETNIVNWAKAYQNTAEIAMFLIELFPEKFAEWSLESEIEKSLPEGNFNRVVGFSSYGMSSFYNALSRVLMLCKSSPRVACVAQNYFELLELLNSLNKNKKVHRKEYPSLENIKDFPDVLIVDLHPNNPVREELFPNRVGHWVKEQLDKDPKRHLFLILDMTLNQLADQDLQETFTILKPYIEEGCLEIFGVQSLAKLVQLGADNFSGGASFYLGKRSSLQFPPSIRQKSAFFGLMQSEFQEEIAQYVEALRENTNRLYDALKERIDKIKDFVEIKEGENRIPFCALNLTMNVDEQTVYVALNFRKLFEILEVDEREQERLTKLLRRTLAEAADLRGLPLTERQSFGFSLTSLSDAKDAIRISVGVENAKCLKKYAELIYDLSASLSHYVARKQKRAILEFFRESFLNANRAYVGDDNSFSVSIPYTEECYDEYAHEGIQTIGEAHVLCQGGKLVMHVYEEDRLTAVQKGGGNIYASSRYFETPFDASTKFQFLFYCKTFGDENLTVTKSPFSWYCIHGFLGIDNSFPFGGEIVNESRGYKITIGSDLSIFLELGGKNYDSKQIFIDHPQLTLQSVRWNKLNEKRKKEALQRLNQYDLCFRDINGVIYITSTDEEIERVNYKEKMVEVWNQSRWQGTLDYLKSLDLEKLPLPHDQTWQYSKSAMSALLDSLRLLGYACPEALLKSKGYIKELQAMDGRFSEAVLEGHLERLMAESVKVGGDPTQTKWDPGLIRDLPVSSYIYQMDSWIEAAERQVRQSPQDKERLESYIEFLAPIVSRCYKTLGSFLRLSTAASLKRLALELEPSPLSQVVANFEAKTFEYASEIKKARVLTFYLVLFIRYPFSEKEKQILVDQLRKNFEGIFVQWLITPNFYFDPIPQDRFEYGMVGDDFQDTIFLEKEREQIREFFNRLNLKPLLEEKLKENPKIFERWQLILEGKEHTSN